MVVIHSVKRLFGATPQPKSEPALRLRYVIWPVIITFKCDRNRQICWVFTSSDLQAIYNFITNWYTFYEELLE